MAELVNKDAVVRFLAGYEENLIGKRAIENGTVYFALKPDPSNSSNTVGSIYIDANGKRIIMSGDGVGVTDTKGELILTKYIKSIEMDGSAGSKATLTYFKGDGSDVPVDMPSAGADTAGVVTTGAQTFAGNKTFSNAVTINGASNFTYAGIEAGTSNAARVVWFAHANKKGTPVYHDAFTYNPSTGTLTVSKLSGLAAKATADGQGNTIYSTYLADVDSSNDGTTFKIWGVKKNEDNSPTTITIGGATNALAGLVTTGDQTFAGIKTFAGFVYSGMSESTANSNRALWFMSSTKGTPTYNDDLFYNPSTKTLTVANLDGVITKATGDSQGNNIYETYLKDIEGTGGDETFTIKGIRGNGNDSPTTITIPAAGDKAGLVTNKAQSFKGKKTFLGFRYSGIAANTALTTDQPIWFMDHATTLGTPAYNTDLTYNPSTKTLKATNFEGLASKATADGNGLNIRENYLKDIENSNSDKHILTLVKGNDNTVNLTLGFVLKSGDTMTGELKTSFKDAVVGGSYASSTHTVPDLAEEIRYSSGAVGSFQLTTAYESPTTKETIPVGWYNFEYIPHRKGGTNGQASGDNHQYGTLLLYGMTVNQQHWRIRIASGAIAEVRRVYNYGDIVTRATGDSAGNNILDKYISEIAISEHTGNSFKFKAYDGNGNDQNEIVLPIDTTGTLASLIVNGAQTLLGIKTFTDGLKVTSKEFRYTGIEVATANQARAVWFADSGDVGKPVYNTNFMYNPSTQTLTVKNITGTISNAIKDEQGNTIYTFYLKDIDSETGTETFQFWGVKGDNADGTIITVPKATSTVAGLMATTDQTFAGIKTFKNNIVLKGDTAGYPQIQKEGSGTSWIYGRDTAVVRITTHPKDDTYNAVTSMKTTNGDWSYGVYKEDIMWWTYTPDTQYTSKTNSGYTQMSLTKDGLLTVPSVRAQTRMTVGGALNTQYTFYNHGTTYLADTLTVDGATQLNSTLGVTGAAKFTNTVEMTSTLLVHNESTFRNHVTIGPNGYAEKQIRMYIDRKKTGGGGWAWNQLSIRGNDGNDFAHYGVLGNADALTYIFIGTKAYNEDNFRIYADGSIWAINGTLKGTLTVDKEATLKNTLTVTGATTLNSVLYANLGIEVKGDIIPVEGDLTQNIGNGIDGNGWNLWGRLRSWHPEKIIRPTSANIAAKGDASLSYFLASSSMTTGKPATDSHIIHMEWDTKEGYSAQVAFPTDDKSETTSNSMQWRTQNGAGTGTSWGGSWRTVLDMQNYNDSDKLETIFVHTAGDEMSGNLKLPNLEATGQITTPILLASNYITIGGAANSNYGLYNYKPTFFADMLTVDNDSNLKRLVITDETEVKHIEFKRTSYNYFAAPTSGSFAFLPNNASVGETNSRLIIDKDGIRPGETNAYNLGTSAKYWKNGYIQTLAVSANATIGGTLGVTGKTTLTDALEVGGATTLKNTLSVTGTGTFNSTVLVKNELTSEGNIWVKNANPYVGFMEGTTIVGYIQADGDCLYVGSTASNSLKIDRTGNVTIPTGVLTLKGAQYEDAYNGALNMNNSDIYGLNSIYTCDLADSSAEGIHFYRSDTTVDTIWVANGTIYFTPNRTLGTAGTSYHVLHTGNYANTLDNIYVLKTGDTMSGTLNVLTSGTTNASVTAANGNGKVGLHASTNQGLYDFTNSRWLIYNRDSDNTVRFAAAMYFDSYAYHNAHLYIEAANSLYIRRNGVSYGRMYAHTAGTAGDGTNNGTVGIGALVLGNSTAVSTETTAGADNARGLLRLYGSNANYTNIYAQANGNRSVYLPNYAGSMYLVHASSNSAVGSTANPVYIAANGRVTACGTSLTDYVKKSGDTMTGNLAINLASGTTSFTAKRTDTGASVSFMVGSGGTNRGVYDNNLSKWIIYSDGTNANTQLKLYGAVWNDYAEFRETQEKIESGRVVIETGRGDLKLSTERLQPGANVVSDTFGFAIGQTQKAKTPLAVAGRVLVYTFEDRTSYEPGDAVCTGPNGTVSKMTREEIWKYPERIVGTVSEIPNYDVWESGDGPLKVNGRIWIKVR